MSSTAFDLIHSPLQGTHIIEASAGTGKTYAISCLFIRLLLEEKLNVKQILVVTFTEAATFELKNRIRDKIKDTIKGFENKKTDDLFLKGLIKSYKKPREKLSCLKKAWHSFDQASIFTIHGFCQRALHDSALESGGLFDTELVVNQDELIHEIAQDYWRKNFYHGSPLFINYAIHKDLGPHTFFQLLTSRINHANLKIIPEISLLSTSNQETDFRNSFMTIKEEWQANSASVTKILMSHKALNRNKYRKKSVPGWLDQMSQYCAIDSPDPVLFNGFEKFTSGYLKDSIKKEEDSPCHPFFNFCQTHWKNQQVLIQSFDNEILRIKRDFIFYGATELNKRKKEKNILYFDDLLLRLHNALKGNNGDSLIKSLRMKYNAALIDEFQDTDPVQYGIFKMIFSCQSDRLFLIGDPKQSIYNFRGADIFAYIQAKNETENEHTLQQNWRSEKSLIKAVNTIFNNHANPFVYKTIPFQPVDPANIPVQAKLHIDGQASSPMNMWFLAAEKGMDPLKPINKKYARDKICKAVAQEISQLLELGKKGCALIGNRSLLEKDIAVLVRTNREAAMMQKALLRIGVPTVLFNSGNIFESQEAMEMERILAGIITHGNIKAIKAAMTTDLFGISGDVLADLMNGQKDWEDWLIKFATYHEYWQNNGFISMFRYLLIKERIFARLAVFPDGERRSTNLLHLSELIQQVSAKKDMGMEELLGWLVEMRQTDKQALEEHLLHLETDESAIQLITIHKSKGLEYPVVFCPFLWNGSRIGKNQTPLVFHDEADQMNLILDLGSDERDKNSILTQNETLAENLRLLYVALTRAKNRVYLVWGRIKDAETSALAYLFHHPDEIKGQDLLNAVAGRFKSMRDEDMFRELEALCQKAEGSIRLVKMSLGQEGGGIYHPSIKGTDELTCREFSGKTKKGRQVLSFSSMMASGTHYLDHRVDPEKNSEPGQSGEEADPDSSSGIFSFPKGKKAGLFFHELFEHLDFTLPEPDQTRTVVEKKLGEYGFMPNFSGIICETIQNVLTVPLSPEDMELKLSNIKNHHKLNEMEFYFPLKKISSDSLKTIFLKHFDIQNIPEYINKLQLAPTKGFMRGFIDLIFKWHNRFYLVDWKSNYLGNRIEDYEESKLALIMNKELYILQYHIYILALDQYLRYRLPEYHYERHIGGIYYIFLRGVHPKPGPGYGIFRDKPSLAIIEALKEGLLDLKT